MPASHITLSGCVQLHLSVAERFIIQYLTQNNTIQGAKAIELSTEKKTSERYLFSPRSSHNPRSPH